MQKQDALSREVKNTLTLCIKTAIATSMEQMLGEDWFTLLKNNEAHLEPPFQVLYKKESIEECDFQALVKILLFREDARDVVIEYYGIDYDGIGGDGSPFDYLLKRIMLSYRNNMDSHISFYQIQQIRNKEYKAIYGYKEAVYDMLKLGEMLKDVTDENGISYYEHMKASVKRYKKNDDIEYYSIREAIKNEGLNINSNQFFNACVRLGLKTKTMNFDIYFGSADYDFDVKRITDEAIVKSSKRLQSNILTASIIAILLSAIMLIGIFYPDVKELYDQRNSISSLGIYSSVDVDMEKIEDSARTLIQTIHDSSYKRIYYLEYNKEAAKGINSFIDSIPDKNGKLIFEIACGETGGREKKAQIVCSYTDDKYIYMKAFYVDFEDDSLKIDLNSQTLDLKCKCKKTGNTYFISPLENDNKSYENKYNTIRTIITDNSNYNSNYEFSEIESKGNAE